MKRRMKRQVDIIDLKEQIKTIRPQSKRALSDYINLFFNVSVPDVALSLGHSSPMDYIWFAFAVDFEHSKRQNADCVVWANRGGGKTQTAAIVTALDCIFKPEIQIRILSGSGYQAGRMYDYFQRYIHLNYAEQIANIKTWPAKKTLFRNGAEVEVLVQTEVSVRGHHVHKLRCDEVELFKTRVYEAAQYTTMGSANYVAAREVISTMHRPHGLMKKCVESAAELKQPVFKWNVWDVIEKCERKCSVCTLLESCEERAKRGRGYYKIDDALTQLERAKERSFYMEMLCQEGTKKNWGWRTGCRIY